MNSNNVTSHEILDPKKRPNDANELLLFSDTIINNETHSIYKITYQDGHRVDFPLFGIS